MRVQQKGFDLLTQQRIIWHEGQRLTQRLTKSSAFCDPILPIEKNMFFDGYAKHQTERIQIILGIFHSTLSNDLHLAKAEQERTGTRGNENARWQQRQGEHCGRGRVGDGRLGNAQGQRAAGDGGRPKRCSRGVRCVWRRCGGWRSSGVEEGVGLELWWGGGGVGGGGWRR